MFATVSDFLLLNVYVAFIIVIVEFYRMETIRFT
jgi:hypothetical protein